MWKTFLDILFSIIVKIKIPIEWYVQKLMK